MTLSVSVIRTKKFLSSCQFCISSRSLVLVRLFDAVPTVLM